MYILLIRIYCVLYVDSLVSFILPTVEPSWWLNNIFSFLFLSPVAHHDRISTDAYFPRRIYRHNVSFEVHNLHLLNGKGTFWPYLVRFNNSHKLTFACFKIHKRIKQVNERLISYLWANRTPFEREVCPAYCWRFSRSNMSLNCVTPGAIVSWWLFLHRRNKRDALKSSQETVA